MATVFLNMVFQGFSIGSNLWLSRWSTDAAAENDTSVRDMYLGVYGAFGAGQGKAYPAESGAIPLSLTFKISPTKRCFPEKRETLLQTEKEQNLAHTYTFSRSLSLLNTLPPTHPTQTH